jgi:hypothetical protein
MWYCRSQCSKFKKQLPPPRCPFPSTVALLRLRRPRGRVLCRKDKPSWLRQISTSEVGIGEIGRKWRIARALLAEFTYTLPSFPAPPFRRVQVDTSNWLNFRRLDFVPVSGGDTVPQPSRHRCRCFFSMSLIAFGLGIHLQAGASGHTLPHRDHL